LQHIKKKSPELAKSPEQKSAALDSTSPSPTPTVAPKEYSTITKSFKDLRNETTAAPKQAVIVEEQKVEIPVTKTNLEFSQTQLEQAWKEFTTSISSDAQAFAIIGEIAPTKNGTDVEIELSAITQKNSFDQNIKPKVVAFLRQKLQNNEISVQVSLKEIEATEARPSTNYEKYNFLLEKNAHLEKLKNQFNLEIE
jgi:hypothetical protein